MLDGGGKQNKACRLQDDTFQYRRFHQLVTGKNELQRALAESWEKHDCHITSSNFILRRLWHKRIYKCWEQDASRTTKHTQLNECVILRELMTTTTAHGHGAVAVPRQGWRVSATEHTTCCLLVGVSGKRPTCVRSSLGGTCRWYYIGHTFGATAPYLVATASTSFELLTRTACTASIWCMRVRCKRLIVEICAATARAALWTRLESRPSNPTSKIQGDVTSTSFSRRNPQEPAVPAVPPRKPLCALAS